MNYKKFEELPCWNQARELCQKVFEIINQADFRKDLSVSLLKSEKGFTLVEILIAMVILGIAFMGLANMQLSSINSNSNSSQLTRAIILAQDKMEEIKSLNPDHPDLADTNPGNNGKLRQSIKPEDSDHEESHVEVKGESTQSVPDLHYGSYTRIWNIADNSPLPGKKTVVVIVTWGPYHKSVAVSSVI